MGSHVSFDDTPSTIEKNLNETNSLAYGKSAFGGQRGPHTLPEGTSGSLADACIAPASIPVVQAFPTRLDFYSSWLARTGRNPSRLGPSPNGQLYKPLVLCLNGQKPNISSTDSISTHFGLSNLAPTCLNAFFFKFRVATHKLAMHIVLLLYSANQLMIIS